MNTPHSDDFLERLLIADARRTLDDSGFSRRVMEALPPPRRTALRTLLILGSTALGCAIATFVAPVGPAIAQGFADIAAGHSLTPAALAAAVAVLGLAATAWVLASDADS
jgi:hypothetical protein